MKKFYIILIIFITFLLVFAVYNYIILLNTNSPEEELMRFFECSSAKAINAEIYFHSRLDPNKYDSMEILKALGVSFSRELGMNSEEEISREIVENDLIQQIDLIGYIPGKKLVNISVQLAKTNDKKIESYICVTVTDNIEKLSLDETRKTVLNVFERFGIETELNSCITGYYEGKLEKSKLVSISEKIFKTAAARKIEGINDKNLISVSAYSPAINNYITVNKKKINLNLAIRYNSYEDKTYIWLATPLIRTEY
jgi:hypothetical protein